MNEGRHSHATVEFRHIMSRFATGVVVVTAEQGGVDHAMTANSFTSVSLDPQLVLFCVEVDSRFHEAVLHAGSWGVSVLAEGQQGRASWFATRGRPLAGQFSATASHRSELTGALLLSDAVATLECRTSSIHRAGDHDVVVGQVLAVSLLLPDADPLIYFGSRYRALGPDTAPYS